MLSKKEREEFVRDGRSRKRKNNFARAKRLSERRFSYSLDDYIRFLTSIQKIFAIPAQPPKKTIAAFNKL